ncbi:PQQ-binding-like beta-propeller repeat protein [Streptomyces sp. NPDC001795]|uniref:outer membrane protein assembly factor BamB family protein n=1 Tax=Streptomyces sp. NPDC001795 TaxID=3154525 RepID=UPI0033290678
MSFGPPPSIYTQSTVEAENRKKRRKLITFAAVATAVAVLCAGVWALSYAAGDSPSDRRPVAARQNPDDIRDTVERPPASPEGTTAVDYRTKLKVNQNLDAWGTWATDKTFAKTLDNRITGFRIGTGQVAWKLAFPGAVCAATRHVTVDGRTAMVFSGEAPQKVDPNDTAPAQSCDQLAMFDIDTGKQLWHVKLPRNGLMGITVTLMKGKVVAAWDAGSAAYAMADGKLLWSHEAQSFCKDSGYAGGKALVRLVTCGSGTNKRFLVQGTNPATGKSEWNYQVAPGVEDVRLVSSSPAVVAVAAGDMYVSDLISLSDRGTHRASISVPHDKYATKCGTDVTDPIENCEGVVVGNGQLYVATAPREFGTAARGQAANEIVAFDLATGKSLRKFDAKSSRPIYPIRMSGDRLIAYRAAVGDALNAAMSIDPATGKQTVLLVFNADSLPLLDDADVRFEHGRIFFAVTTVAGPAGKDGEGDSETVAEGFGTG